MKILLLTTFVFLTIYSVNTFSSPWSSARNYFFPRGSLADYAEFERTLTCRNCNLQYFDLAKIINRPENADKQINLAGSNCTGTNLNNINITGANLVNVNMQNANVKNTSINTANLTGASFYGAKVNEKTFFTNSNCDSVDFRNTDLNRLKPPNFKGAILKNCKRGSTLSYKIRAICTPIFGRFSRKLGL